MKIYKDHDFTQEVKDEIFDLGIVPAGETKKFTFYIFNDSNAFLKNLKFSVKHDEVRIIKFPEKLAANMSGELILEWKPSVTLKEGLKARLRISGIELWG